jgi:spectinomycin phosphotransferase
VTTSLHSKVNEGRSSGKKSSLSSSDARQLPVVRGQLEHVEERVIRDAIVDGWGLRIDDFRYLPEGGGAYHWIALTDDACRWFVTCDDLQTKPWLGSDRDAVFEGLLAAYGAAMDLRSAGLAFVAAPIATESGAPAKRVDERHSVSVLRYIVGEPGQWGRALPPPLGEEVVAILAALHRATPSVRSLAPRGFELPGRDRLEQALDEVDHAWGGGPLSELARRELAGHARLIVRWLDDLDRFAATLDGAGGNAVVTHGEPHPGNLLRTAAGLALVDWDTVALAAPERDLWMLADQGETAVSSYTDLTGITLDRDALTAYRLLWALSDVAAFTAQLREEHRQDPDAEKALTGLSSILAGREPTPYGSQAP